MIKVTKRLNTHWADLEMSEVELEKLIAPFGNLATFPQTSKVIAGKGAAYVNY